MRRARAHVRDVKPRPGQLRQQHAALDTERLGRAGNAAQAERRRVKPLVGDAVAFERRVLAMLDHRHVEHPRVLERAAHQQRRRHRMAVVADGDAAGVTQLGDVGQQLALRSLGHRADRIDAREIGFSRLAQDQRR